MRRVGTDNRLNLSRFIFCCQWRIQQFLDVLDEYEVGYYCNCSREKIENIVTGMSKEELEDIVKNQGELQAECHFCNKKYVFTKEELQKIISTK